MDLNLGTGIAVILALRWWSSAFVSMYFVNDATIGLASMFQAVAFQWCRTPSSVKHAIRHRCRVQSRVRGFSLARRDDLHRGVVPLVSCWGGVVDIH
jgi:hypothetical protein